MSFISVRTFLAFLLTVCLLPVAVPSNIGRRGGLLTPASDPCVTTPHACPTGYQCFAAHSQPGGYECFDPSTGRYGALAEGQWYVSRWHVCAIFRMGSRLKCWGQLWSGYTDRYLGVAQEELGDDMPYVDLGTGRYAKSLPLRGSSDSHGSMCVILENDSIKCFGSNSHGQAGYGWSSSSPTNIIGDVASEMGDNLPEVNLGGLPVVQVACGNEYVCVILGGAATGSRIKCWGRNHQGQLGDGSYTNTNSPPTPYVSGSLPGHAVRIAVGNDRTMALMDNGELWGWGQNSAYGVLGIGSATTTFNTPQGPVGGVLSGRTVAQFSTAGAVALVRFTDGTMAIWGRGDQGCFGEGSADTTTRTSPTTLATNPSGELVTDAIVGAGGHVCFVTDKWHTRCLGPGSVGRLGRGSSSDYGAGSGETIAALAPIVVASGTRCVNTDGGNSNTVCMNEQGRFQNWGTNNGGMGATGSGRATTIHFGDESNEMGDLLPFGRIGEHSISPFPMQYSCVQPSVVKVDFSTAGDAGDLTSWNQMHTGVTTITAGSVKMVRSDGIVSTANGIALSSSSFAGCNNDGNSDAWPGQVSDPYYVAGANDLCHNDPSVSLTASGLDTTQRYTVRLYVLINEALADFTVQCTNGAAPGQITRTGINRIGVFNTVPLSKSLIFDEVSPDASGDIVVSVSSSVDISMMALVIEGPFAPGVFPCTKHT